MKLIIPSTLAISPVHVEVEGFTLLPYIRQVRAAVESGEYSVPEASVNLPTDERLLAAVDALVKNISSPALKYIFVIGIGGSNLGTKAVYEALQLAPDIVGQSRPRVWFLDTNNPVLLTAQLTLLQSLTAPEEYVCISISKSGGTTETIANTEIFLAAVREKWADHPDRLIVISDAGSPYLTAAQTVGAHCLSIPLVVGGRYSVFSAVGLVPLALARFDIRNFCRGAESMISACCHLDIKRNPAATSALLQVEQYRAGKYIHDLFIFNSELESLGKWWRQLLAESVGKSVIPSSTTNAVTDMVGITPTVSIGSTDLHSVGQLYLGGPRDKLTTFLSAPTTELDLTMPKRRVFPHLVPMIDGATTGTIMSAILAGTKAAYTEHNRPYLEITLDAISLFELGAFMQYKMIETMYIGHLLGVDPFNQPNVEAYKIKTKEILEGKN